MATFIAASRGLRRLLMLGVGVLLSASCHQAAAPPASGAASTAAAPPAAATASASSWEGFMPDAGPVLVGHEVKPSDLTESELKYGVAPKRMTGVTYQDDIILMEHGDKAIRSLNSDGMGWVLDAKAPLVEQIQPGKIVFATSRCVGRVLAVERKGDEVSLVLGPIQLTDVIKKGNFSYDQPLDLNSVVAYSAPDYPGAVNSAASQQMEKSEQTSSTSSANSYHRSVSYFVVTDGDWRPMRTVERGGSGQLSDGVWRSSDSSAKPWLTGNLPSMPSGVPSVPTLPPIPDVVMQNGMSLSPCWIGCNGIGLKLYQEKAGVKVWVSAVFHLATPRLTFHLGIANGSVNADVALSGAAGFTVTLDALADLDLKANLTEIGAVPMDITVPIGGMAVPLTAQFGQNLDLATAFSAKTSVLHASGDLTANGAVHMTYINGHWDIPKLEMTLKNNLADSVSGESVGINSLVFAVDQRLLIGVGTLGFATGPYVNLITSITALKQASQARDCRQGTFGMQLGGGIGYSMPKVVAKVINFFLGLIHVTPVPASGFIVRLKQNVILVDLKNQIPDGCAGK